MESHAIGESARSSWSVENCEDLMQCYEDSDPNRRGYMKRMHELWINMHPDLDIYTPQNLRDQVAALQRRGFRGRPAEETTHEAPDGPNDEDNESVELRERFHALLHAALTTNRKRTIHFKQYIDKKDMARINKIVAEYLQPDSDLWTVDSAVYAAGRALTPKKETNQYLVKLKGRLEKIEEKIATWRRKASRTETVIGFMTAGTAFTTKVRKIARELKKEHHTLNRNTLSLIKETALDKLKSLKLVRKKIKEQIDRSEQNRMFNVAPSKFLQKKGGTAQTPAMGVTEAYWKNLYEQPNQFRPTNKALGLFRTAGRKLIKDGTECEEISLGELQTCLSQKRNYASPGPDAINVMWWKHLTSTHVHIHRIFNDYLRNPNSIPEWLAEGRTVLLYKKGDPTEPKNYRPITCLNTIYKVFTSTLQRRIVAAIQPIWETIYEQRGTKTGVAGVRENLLIDRSVCQDATYYKRNLSMAWVDYRKAFDSTSHQLIIHLLTCMGVHRSVTVTIQRLMETWRTRLAIREAGRERMSDYITYHRGVYQGDSLSPLLFCISLLPLSLELRQHKGYRAGPPNSRTHTITHLFYLDDLKLYAQTEKDIKAMLDTVKLYSNDIGMEFGMEKCAVYNVQKGRDARESENIELVDGTALRHLAPGETYTYLGIPQNRMHQSQILKETLTKKYKNMLWKIWSSQLNGKNKIAATNCLALPLVSHTFGSIPWNQSEIHVLDRSTRKIMTKCRSLHPNASVQRLYLQRSAGGRGLISIEDIYKQLTISSAIRVQISRDPLLKLVATHETKGNGSFLYKDAMRAAQDLGFNLKLGHRPTGELLTMPPAQLKTHIKKNILLAHHEVHYNKPMHGLYYKNIDDQHLSTTLSFGFLKSSGLRSETEGYITAVQDGVYHSLAYRVRVMGMTLGSTQCRACKTSTETTMHLLTACSKYAPNMYIRRHDAALKVLYCELRSIFSIDAEKKIPYAMDDIPGVVANENCKLFWNFPFSTTTEIRANKPDLVILAQREKKMYVVEMSCPADTNIIRKEEEKEDKYRPLLYELSRTYHPCTPVFVPIIIGAMGGIHPNTQNHLKKIKAIPTGSVGKIVGNMQKAVILGSLHILRSHEASHPPS